MSLADIAPTAADIAECATTLRDEFDAILLTYPKGSQTHNELYALKLRVCWIKAESHKLTTLVGTARMTQELPNPHTITTDTAPSPEGIPQGFQPTRMPYQPPHERDRKMAAAGDHSLDDR